MIFGMLMGRDLILDRRADAAEAKEGAKAFLARRTSGVPVRTRKLAPLALAECTFFKDARPPHTSMSTGRFTAITGIHPRPWQEALEDHLRAMQAALAFSSTPS